jgi:small subunit ribosomal protein S20
MANTQSAKKRARQTIKKTVRNQAIKSHIRTALKQAYKLIQEGQAGDTVKQGVLDAVSTVMKAASKGVLHKRNAARKVSRLTSAYSLLLKKSLGEAADSVSATVAAVEAKATKAIKAKSPAKKAAAKSSTASKAKKKK